MNQKGYVIQIVLVVFAVIIGLMIFPFKPPAVAPQDKCQIGDAPDGSEPIIHTNAMLMNPDRQSIYDVASFGPDPDRMADYKILRKNVPILKNTLERARGPAPDHTYIGGELPQKPGFDVHFPKWVVAKLFGERSFPIPDERVLIFIKRTSVEAIDDRFYIADIYQDTAFLTDRPYNTDELFDCTTDVVIESPEVVVPGQTVSQSKDQLQMEWFQFSQNKYWQLHCKPAVYLYPEKKQLVNVKVYPKGELSYTDPPYDAERGWTVEAYPTGMLQIPNAKSQIPNGYLYYESKILDNEIKKPSKGWVVSNQKSNIKNEQSSRLRAQKDLKQLLDEILPGLGLNEKEAKDFKDYWLTKLPQSPYYFVGLVEKEQRDYLEALKVTPNPDTSIRFSLYFEMLDQPKEVEEPVIQTPKRNGFTLVDWGGMVKLHPGTPFTCSQ